MPVIVPPGTTAPTPPVQAASADNRIRAITHPEGGGVFLYADFSDLNPAPRKVRFVRGLDQVPVRSGHDATAPGGTAVAYDREAPGGVPSAWYAIPVFWQAGRFVDGPSSAGVQLVAPTVDVERDFWIKSIATPLQLRLSARYPLPEVTRQGRDASQEVPGSPYLAGGWDVPLRQPITYTFRTYTLEEFEQLEELLDAGPMLLQALRAYGIRDEYYKLRDLRSQYMIKATDPRRTVALTLSPCRRPPTEGAPLYVPGHSWADGQAAYLSWEHASALVETWLDLLINTPPAPEGIIPETGGEGDEGSP